MNDEIYIMQILSNRKLEYINNKVDFRINATRNEEVHYLKAYDSQENNSECVYT